jgi:hypothetical protein
MESFLKLFFYCGSRPFGFELGMEREGAWREGYWHYYYYYYYYWRWRRRPWRRNSSSSSNHSSRSSRRKQQQEQHQWEQREYLEQQH